MASLGRCSLVLWDDCLELEAFIQSNTWNSRYANQGEVLEAIMSGETSDISTFAQHDWYEWLMFHDSAVAFQDSKEVQGRDLGPSIDVGPAMTAKILKSNGEVVHRSTYRSLTEQELVHENHRKERADFHQAVSEGSGTVMTADDFCLDEDIEVVPVPNRYADDRGEKLAYARC